MGLFTMFGKKKQEVKQNLAKVENRDLMQAIVGGSMLVAHADGTCEESELSKLDKTISALPELQHFGSEISDTINRFRQQFEVGFRIGRQKALKEIEDLKASPDEKLLCFNVMVTIAEADGEIGPEETKVLKDVATLLGINLREFGLE